ncbi:hypothetical protein B0H14DRAFT_528290 [Mycena olivaceomarginata]|nr:hypothetical protein B0H14DRAFT_528290 [Mycena olivaceomarginata]
MTHRYRLARARGPHGARNRYRAVSVRGILALLVIGWNRWCRTRALDPRCVKSPMVQMVGGDWVALRLACGTCRRASPLPFISILLSLCLVDFIRRLALALTHTSRLQLLISFTILFIHLLLNLCISSVHSSSAGTSWPKM